MSVYLISDCHFGHSNILKFRNGFNSIEEHDRTITDNILGVCGKRDTLYILGDVCVYKDSWKYVEEIASGVEFLHICLGNHCISDDTEVLCEGGWRPANTVSKEDLVASVDLKTGEMSFDQPNRVWSVGYQKMVSLKSDKIEELVTEKHRVVYQNNLVPVCDLPSTTLVRDYLNSGTVNREGIDISDGWIKLLTWVVCDGTLVQDKVYDTKKRVQFKLSKPRKIEALTSLLKDVGIPYSLKLCKKTGINNLQPYYIRIYGDSARDIFKKLECAKKFPHYFRKMNQDQFKVFYETLSITDGSVSCNIMSMVTTCEEDAETIQYCAVTNGYDCRIVSRVSSGSGFSNGKHQYRVDITNDSSKNTKRVYKEDLEVLQKATAISTVNGTIVTRRNGKVSVTGNCNERKGSPTLEDYMSVCKSVFGMKKYKNAWLTHGPLHPEELRGKLNVHGHVHSCSINDERYVNVSCENTGYFPINFVDIQNGWRGA